MPHHPEYENLSKEELLVLMKQRTAKHNTYSWKKSCTLTREEGAKLECDFLSKYDCENVSQFLKKIVRGELIVTEA